jgi:hypothetical protein
MTRRTNLRVGLAFGALLIAVLSLSAAAPAAFAVQSDQYDVFTACPTDDPSLNDPTTNFAICGAGSAPGGTLQIGERTIPLSRLRMQFASRGFGLPDPDCPQPELCFGQLPGSTTVESAPGVIPIHPGRGEGKGSAKNAGKGKARQLRITVESAGDVSAVSPGFLFGVEVPLYKLPIKLHLESPWLGDDCYVGSDSDPIYFVPFMKAAPAKFDFLSDPNGLPVETLVFRDMPIADEKLEIPAAKGCGHGRASENNALVNDLLGLPSPSGQNALVLPHSDLTLVGAGFDGTPPDGGAALQAAFEAAR